MLTQIINGKILTPQGWLADGSVLIEDGKIAEKGTHEELMRLNGRYAQMYRTQMGTAG